jgi:LacI family transcriptional regulator
MITLDEIAKLANVSRGTIDRVIHKRGRVSEETQQRVKEIIKKFDYKPNILARGLSRTKTCNIAVIIPQFAQDGKYWELPTKGINKAQDELKVYKVKITFFLYDKFSEASFERACQSFLCSEVQFDAMLLAPVLYRATEKFIQKIPNTLPYVFIDSYIPRSKCLAYVGEDSFQSGLLAAKLMNILIKGKTGTISVFQVIPEDYHIMDRIKGFHAFFENCSNFLLKNYQVNREEDELVFFKKTGEILRENPDVLGIFVPNACMYQVANYLKLYPPKEKISLVGYDLVEESKPHIKSGTIDFAISQRSELQGYESVYSLFKHVVLHSEIPEKIIVPLDIVTKENMDYYHD